MCSERNAGWAEASHLLPGIGTSALRLNLPGETTTYFSTTVLAPISPNNWPEWPLLIDFFSKTPKSGARGTQSMAQLIPLSNVLLWESHFVPVPETPLLDNGGGTFFVVARPKETTHVKPFSRYLAHGESSEQLVTLHTPQLMVSLVPAEGSNNLLWRNSLTCQRIL